MATRSRNDAVHAAAAGPRAARSGRLDGQRLGAGVLSDKPRMLYDYFKQLFAQVTNPADRFDPRRSDHVARVLHRARGEPARDDAGARASAAHCRIRSCRTKKLAALKHIEPSRLEVAHDRHHLRRERRATPDCSTALDRICDEAAAGDRRRLSASSCCPIARSQPRPRAAQLAAGDRRGASSPGAQARAHADRHRRRNRRSPRSASSLPAGRLRRRCDQSVPGVRSRCGKRVRGRPAAKHAHRARATTTSCYAYRKAVAKGCSR